MQFPFLPDLLIHLQVFQKLVFLAFIQTEALSIVTNQPAKDRSIEQARSGVFDVAFLY